MFASDVDARIARAGLFPGSNPIIRAGAWSFVEVELKTRAAKPFDGELRIEQIDRDGDVTTSILKIALAPSADWRPYQIYLLPYDQEQFNSLKVQLFDVQGRLAPVTDQTGNEANDLTLEHKVLEIRSDDYLVVDLSAPKRLPHVAWLDCDRRSENGRQNARKVRSMLPRDLPNRTIGLEAVDAIVWDDADPSGLGQEQCDALLGWVQAGGRLLITGGKNWQMLAASPIAAALPVTLSGMTEVNEAQDFTDLVEADDYRGWLERRYQKQAIQRCKMKPLADAIPMPADDSVLEKMIYRRLVGRGTVTFIGASLMQLLPPSRKMLNVDDNDPDAKAGPTDSDFIPIACEKLTARRLLALPPVIDEESGARQNYIGNYGKTDLFEKLRATIGFEAVGSAFLLFAILFAIAYTLAATTGSYWYMKKKSWLHHSWSAFAVVAIVCSVLGTGMVWVLRGFTTKLWQTTFVDAHANNDQGNAFALFGVKTPDHTHLNLRLPVGGQVATAGETCPIRPIAKSDEFENAESHFVASDRYQSALAGTSLEKVPLRATLKEFQGTWHGALGGMLQGKLVVKKNSEEDASRIKFDLTDDSYLQNNLGVTLHDCLLIMMPPDSDVETVGERPVVGGYCFDLDNLAKAGDRARLSAQQLRRKLFYEPSTLPDDAAIRRKTLPSLSGRVSGWHHQFGFLGGDASATKQNTLTPDQEYASMLLLSTFNLLRPDRDNRLSIVRSHGRALDATHQLTKRSALLIGWSDEPSPVVLERDLTALRPDRSRTIYRFVIPVEKN